MTFLALTPAMAALVLATTAAAVALLYWLKPPPKRVVVPSSLLWDRLLREKKRSTWLDRLRWLISLLIALGIGLSVAAAIGRPEVGSGDAELDRITVVIDNSATMATRTSDGFRRWDHAVAEARSLLQRGSAGGQFLVVDTAGQAPPTNPGDRRDALELLDGLTVSLGGQTQFPLLPESDAPLYFISDGVMVDGIPAEAIPISVFEPADNVGITAFEIRAVPSAPFTYQAFLEVTNSSPGPKEVAVRLSGSGASPRGETMSLQPGESQGRTVELSGFDRGPVRAAVTTDRDAFAGDDFAYSFLPVRARTRILLVSPGSVYLENALVIESGVELIFRTPEQYDGRLAADVYIFDRWAPPSPPPGPALVFLPPDVSWMPPTLEVVDSPQVGGWNRDHPVLQFVSLEDLRVNRAARVAVGGGQGGDADGGRRPAPGAADGEVLVGDQRLPLIATFEIPERIIRVGFALEDSNFRLQPGFPIFLSNALSWMTDEQVARSSPPGRIEVPLAGAAVADLEGNVLTTWPLSDRTVFLAEEPGLYTATRGTRRLRVAVNLADPERSAVNATGFGPEVRAAATPGILGAVEPGGWGEELWMLLLGMATVLVVGEWFTYNRRLTV